MTWAKLKSLIEEMRNFKKLQQDIGLIPKDDDSHEFSDGFFNPLNLFLIVVHIFFFLDRVLLEDMPFILCNAGYPYSKPEVDSTFIPYSIICVHISHFSTRILILHFIIDYFIIYEY